MIENEKFIVKVLPHLNTDYFDTYSDKVIFSAAKAFITKYHKKPNYNVIKNAISKLSNLNENSYQEINDKLDSFSLEKEKYDLKWLVDETEIFCKNKAVENAIFKSVNIYEDEEKSNHQIQDLVKKALSISFNTEIGIEYFNKKDIKKRYKKMTSKVNKIPCHIDEFNTLCGGGIETKGVTCLIGDTHVGKTISMVSLCASYIRFGYDVLYITMEMSEEKITQLFDANFIKMEINDIPTLTYEEYTNGVLNVRKEGYGRLIVREFPTGNASTNDFRILLEELKLKLNFNPTVVAADYLNIMKSDRFSDRNSYTIVKAIAEEFRGLMLELDTAGLTCSQLNREGAGSSNPGMRDVAESYGLPQTVDCLIAMYTNEELIDKNVIIWKVLKNRFGGIINYKFAIRAMYEYATLSNMKKNDDDGVAFIQNSERSKALMEKMKNKNKNIINNDNDTNEINDLFDEDEVNN